MRVGKVRSSARGRCLFPVPSRPEAQQHLPACRCNACAHRSQRRRASRRALGRTGRRGGRDHIRTRVLFGKALNRAMGEADADGPVARGRFVHPFGQVPRAGSPSGSTHDEPSRPAPNASHQAPGFCVERITGEQGRPSVIGMGLRCKLADRGMRPILGKAWLDQALLNAEPDCSENTAQPQLHQADAYTRNNEHKPSIASMVKK